MCEVVYTVAHFHSTCCWLYQLTLRLLEMLLSARPHRYFALVCSGVAIVFLLLTKLFYICTCSNFAVFLIVSGAALMLLSSLISCFWIRTCSKTLRFSLSFFSQLILIFRLLGLAISSGACPSVFLFS